MAQFREGNDAKVDINGVPYAGAFFRVRSRDPEQDVSNFEGKAGNPAVGAAAVGYASHVGSNRVGNVEIRGATLDLEENFFIAPMQVAKGGYCTVRIYPNGRDDDYHFFNSLKVSEVSHEGQAGGLQPISLTGISDGEYLLYGEAK
jgi:hypothetical protein